MKKRFTKFAKWVKSHKTGSVLFLFLVLTLAPRQFQTQLLPDPCCPILSAGLTTIADLLKTVVGIPLGEIQKIQDQINKYQREVI